MRRQDDVPDDTLNAASNSNSNTTSNSIPMERSTGLLGVSTGQDEAEQRSRMQQERHAEALSLRKRGAELEELLVAARSRRTSARERREFMKEEAEEVRAVVYITVLPLEPEMPDGLSCRGFVSRSLGFSCVLGMSEWYRQLQTTL